MSKAITCFKFNVNLEAIEDMRLPEYKGSMFRGAFGWAFRNAVCVTGKKDCNGCMLLSHCSYFKIFETEMPETEVYFLKGVKKLPHPFIIHPPLSSKRDYKKGQLIQVGLTIFEDYVNLFPFFAYTFQRMGRYGISYRRNKFALSNILSIDDEGNEYILFDSSRNNLKTEYRPIKIDIFSTELDLLQKIRMDFVTPFRVQNDGNILKKKEEVSPMIHYKSLFRRVQSIYTLYSKGGTGDIEEQSEVDFIISENNLEFDSWKRYSSRQHGKMNLGGFRGSITLEGNLRQIATLIHACSYFNIGKNTLFGLGQFNYEVLK